MRLGDVSGVSMFGPWGRWDETGYGRYRPRNASRLRHGAHALPVQVAGVEQEAELLATVEHFQRAFRAVQVEGDLAGVDFKGEPHAGVAAGVEDRVPAVGEVAEAGLDRGGIRGRPAG